MDYTIANGTENSLVCFDFPNYNDTTFMLFLSSEDYAVLLTDNLAAVVTVDGKTVFVFCICLAVSQLQLSHIH